MASTNQELMAHTAATLGANTVNLTLQMHQPHSMSMHITNTGALEVLASVPVARNLCVANQRYSVRPTLANVRHSDSRQSQFRINGSKHSVSAKGQTWHLIN